MHVDLRSCEKGSEKKRRSTIMSKGANIRKKKIKHTQTHTHARTHTHTHTHTHTPLILSLKAHEVMY